MAAPLYLTRSQVANYAAAAGWSGNNLIIAVAIAQAESSFNARAVGGPNANGSYDYGLWQVNSAHGYDANQLINNPSYNAAAAYQIFQRQGWNAWTTYTNGSYQKYLSTSGTSTVKTATNNNYPKGQCTWWAAERYHQLTGYYVPWMGNAKDWVGGANSYGWQVSAVPAAPSIIVLQPGIQGADASFGHVGVVEKINNDGTVTTSDQNWNGITYPASTTVKFTPGNGVSFVYAVAGSVSTGSAGSGGTIPISLGNSGGSLFVPVLQQVHSTLIATPGFLGIAQALDEVEQFPGYVNLSSGSLDVIGNIRSVGATVSDNFVPFLVRSGLFLLGFILLLLLLARVVAGVAENGISTAEKVAPLAAAFA